MSLFLGTVPAGGEDSVQTVSLFLETVPEEGGDCAAVPRDCSRRK